MEGKKKGRCDNDSTDTGRCEVHTADTVKGRYEDDTPKKYKKSKKMTQYNGPVNTQALQEFFA